MNRYGQVASRCDSCRTQQKKDADAAYGRLNRERHNEANRRYRARTKKPAKTTTHVCACGLSYEKVHVGGRVPGRCPKCTSAHKLQQARLNTAKRRSENPDYFTSYRKLHSKRLTERALRWAKENPEKHRARGNRYRSRKYSNVIEYFTREELGDRDNWTCGVCGQTIDRKLRHPHPLAGEHDHIVPVTHPEYPGNTWENSAIVHSRCNKAKGGYRAR